MTKAVDFLIAEGLRKKRAESVVSQIAELHFIGLRTFPKYVSKDPGLKIHYSSLPPQSGKEKRKHKKETVQEAFKIIQKAFPNLGPTRQMEITSFVIESVKLVPEVTSSAVDNPTDIRKAHAARIRKHVKPKSKK